MNAIVTGAARWLGAAIAKRLTEDGLGVALVDVAGSITETAEELEAGGAKVTALRGDASDVSDARFADDAVERTLRELGSVEVLVNNAGIGGPSTDAVTTDPAAFLRVLKVNLVEPFLMAQAAARAMIDGGRGEAIVNMGSVFGQQGVAGGAAFCASKGGVALLTH